MARETRASWTGQPESAKKCPDYPLKRSPSRFSRTPRAGGPPHASVCSDCAPYSFRAIRFPPTTGGWGRSAANPARGFQECLRQIARERGGEDASLGADCRGVYWKVAESSPAVPTQSTRPLAGVSSSRTFRNPPLFWTCCHAHERASVTTRSNARLCANCGRSHPTGALSVSGRRRIAVSF